MTRRGLFLLVLLAATPSSWAGWGTPCETVLTESKEAGGVFIIARCRWVAFNNNIYTGVRVEGKLDVPVLFGSPDQVCSGAGTCGMSASISPYAASETYTASAEFKAYENFVLLATKSVSGSVVTADAERPQTDPTPIVPCEGVCSPIIIDLDGNDFHLTSAAAGVTFDLNADGVPERVAWTRGDQGDVFLSLDRNGSGTIDSGAELFGNSVRLRSGGLAEHGYEALAEFDDAAAGGNGDGVLDAADAIWPALRAWRDGNHNGISESGELDPLAVAGLTNIDLHYQVLQRRDQHGNEFRYRSSASVNGRREIVYDVFLLQQH